MAEFCRYSSLYTDADTSYVVNIRSKHLKPIRISSPSPPPIHLIDGWGEHPDKQIFKKLEIPKKLKRLEEKIYRQYSNANTGVNGTNVLRDFWKELESKEEFYKAEIKFMKHFVWYMYNGYWIFIDGKPTYLPPWYFTYLNLHRMTTEEGYSFPEYREKGRLRFMFYDYLFKTRETFADIDPKDGQAFKVKNEDGSLVYRMVDTGRRTFFGPIVPKDRRGGLTNEACHVINRQATSQKGADKLCTIVSMGGDNADTHFRKKLVPAWNSWPLFLRPIWVGGFGKLKSLEFTSNSITGLKTLDTSINFTESGDDLINDGKMIIGALYDEQGKGKRTGNVQNRWQINKETMSLGGGSKIIGFCLHPSTVEKMEEGGKDYKDMCDMSDFYHRKKDGQTISGLSICYFPSSFCLEGYMDCFGKPVYRKPTERQIRLGYKGRIGSKTFIENKRKDLYDPEDPAKMDEYRSFVRKYPEDYDECWTGVAGQLGFDNESIRLRKTELINDPQTVKGEFVWIDKRRLIVEFVEKRDGKWIVNMRLPRNEANQSTSMMDYSAFEDEEIAVNRPKYPKRFIVGVDPQRFSNKAEAHFLKGKNTKKSDTSIVVKRRRDPNIDISEDHKKWITPHFVAAMRERMNNSRDATDEVMKVCVYYGGLAHIETNVTEVWERMIEQKFGGYLNYNIDYTATGEPKRASKPGTALSTNSKKTGFSLLADYFNLFSRIEPIKELLDEADQISSMEQLTNMDMLAAAMEAVIGEKSSYAEYMEEELNEEIFVESLGATPLHL